ncbi:MAG: family 10 glycosylhydrolase [Chthonomonas sp.]|nr:family 10 glycosylhydrolase [Chthonomonas sp.]
MSLLCLLMLYQSVALPEVRGTWLTTTSNDAISNPLNTATTMRRLREIGLNTVYVEVWKDGYTEFPSETMREAIGVPLRVNASPSGAVQRDLLQETLIEAHRNQLTYIAWFEYGFIAAYKDSYNHLRTRKDWLSRDRDGNVVAKNGFVWLNPIHPDAQSLILGIVLDAVRKYDLDGIQFDDRIVWPYIDMGYDEFTVALYAREHGGKAPPTDPRDPEWMQWRQRKVEDFSKRLVTEVKKTAGRNFIVSLSPGPHPWALENYLIDWPSWGSWTSAPSWDEFVPQVYRLSYEDFARDWHGQVGFAGPRRKNLIAGIRLTGDGPDAKRGDIEKYVKLTRQTFSLGHSWWYSKGVLDLFSSEISKVYDVAKLGQASHPRLGVNWRPLPIKAVKVAVGQWVATLPVGRYRAVAQKEGVWHEIKTFEAKRFGKVSVQINADAVEFLVSRKKFNK